MSVLNFNLHYNFWTQRDKDFIFVMLTPLKMPFKWHQCEWSCDPQTLIFVLKIAFWLCCQRGIVFHKHLYFCHQKLMWRCWHQNWYMYQPFKDCLDQPFDRLSPNDRSVSCSNGNTITFCVDQHIGLSMQQYKAPRFLVGGIPAFPGGGRDRFFPYLFV